MMNNKHALISVAFLASLLLPLARAEENSHLCNPYFWIYEATLHDIKTLENPNQVCGRFYIIHLATMSRRNPITKALIQRGADVRVGEALNQNTSLHYAIGSENTPLIHNLIAAGANIDIPNRRGNTPLHIAVAFGRIYSAEYLLNAGANPNARNKKGETPVHKVASSGNWHMIPMLYKNDADFNPRTYIKGKTPLHYACLQEERDPDLIETLIDAGADPSLPDNEGNTNLECVSQIKLAMKKK